jgi:hypothetical protein
MFGKMPNEARKMRALPKHAAPTLQLFDASTPPGNIRTICSSNASLRKNVHGKMLRTGRRGDRG